MDCKKCGEPIDQERINFFAELEKEITTCVTCSREQKKIVLMDYAHKTAGYAVVIPNKPDGTVDKEQLRLALRAYYRSR